MTEKIIYSYYLIPYFSLNGIIKDLNLINKFKIHNIETTSLQEAVTLIDYAIYDRFLDDFTKEYAIIRTKEVNNNKNLDLYFWRFQDLVLVKSLDGLTLSSVSYEDDFPKLKDQELFP